jgi:hypothetical protein
MGSARPKLEQLSRPLHSFAEADYLAVVGRGSAKRWLAGYHRSDSTGNRIPSPPITPMEKDSETVSFLDLMEVVAIDGASLELAARIPDARYAGIKVRPFVHEAGVE